MKVFFRVEMAVSNLSALLNRNGPISWKTPKMASLKGSFLSSEETT